MNKSDRNRSAILPDLEKLLAEQSQDGYFGSGSLEWTVRDGLVQTVTASPKRTRTVKEKKVESS
jgi:hypothetical protein